MLAQTLLAIALAQSVNLDLPEVIKTGQKATISVEAPAGTAVALFCSFYILQEPVWPEWDPNHELIPFVLAPPMPPPMIWVHPGGVIDLPCFIDCSFPVPEPVRLHAQVVAWKPVGNGQVAWGEISAVDCCDIVGGCYE